MKILYIQPGPGIGGSKISLLNILRSAPSDQTSQVALSFPVNLEYESQLSNAVEKVHYLDLPTWQKYRRKTLAEKLKAPFSHIYRLYSIFPASIRLARLIKNENIDLIHTNNSICAAGALAAWITHKPHIWHIREPIGKNGEYHLILGDRLSKYLYNALSQTIICNSHYTAEFFLPASKKVSIINNGIDKWDFDDAFDRGKMIRASLGINPNTLVLAMVGNITTSWKKHGVFLEIAAQVQKISADCKFVVYGGNSDLSSTSYTKSLKDMASNLGLEKNLIWSDYIADIPAMMHSFDILIHPADREGSGRVIMEAMAAGKCVVAVKSGGAQELIQDGVTGFLVKPDDISGFTDKVRKLLSDSELMAKIENQAQIHACKHFSNEKMMQKIIEIYRNTQYL